MSKLLFSILLLLGSSAWGEYPDGLSCEFTTRTELLNEANKILTEFSQLDSFDELFFTPNDPSIRDVFTLESKANSEALKAQSLQKKLSPSEASVASILKEFRNDPLLHLLSKRGFLQLNLTQDDGRCDGAPACTSFGDYSVVVSENSLNKYYMKFGPSVARKIMSGIMGHEVGHFVFDINRFTRGQFSSYQESTSSLNLLKYHVTVDAVGMLLTGLSIDDFIEILSATVTAEEEAGDIPARIKCLTDLK